jgi:hypothetical protein
MADQTIVRGRAADARDLQGVERETRDTASSAPVSEFRPASLLPDPTPQPGYVLRWIRKSAYGRIDERNMWERQAEGWVPVRPNEQPELCKCVVTTTDPANGLIEVGGLVLMKATAARMQARTDYYAKLARSQMIAVDNSLMRMEDRRMPFLTPLRQSIQSKVF